MTAHKAKISSDMRSVAVSFATYAYSGGRIKYDPEKYKEMRDLLEMFAKVDLFHASHFLSPYDLKHIDAEPPEEIAYRTESGEIVFLPEILNFPIAYSFAVYPDLDSPSSTTPLFWTRGLHNYETFKKPYGGHVAFLDGHVMYYGGEPGQHDPELEKIFGPGSEFSRTIRIIEHEPEDWREQNLEPLPVRYTESLPSKHKRVSNSFFILLAPAALAAVLVGLLPKPTIRQRLWSAFVAFGIVLIATLILVTAVIS